MWLTSELTKIMTDPNLKPLPMTENMLKFKAEIDLLVKDALSNEKEFQVARDQVFQQVINLKDD